MATPNPLPAPTPAPPVSPLSLMLESAAAAAGPNVPAEVVSGVAQTAASPQDAVTGVQAAGQYLNTAQAVTDLQGQSAGDQQTFWKELPAAQQAQFQAAGYKPPAAPGRSIWGDITHGLSVGLHDTLNAAGAPLRAVQHVERTLLAPPRSGDVAGFWGNLFSPQNWADAWNQTNSGEKYIQPRVERQVFNTYGSDTYDLALKLATGTNPQQLLSSVTDPTAQQALATKIQSDPQLHQAVTELQNGHLSVGRMLLGEHFLTQHPLAGRVMSGGVDATLGWFGDPTVVGLKAAKAGNVARYIVRNGQDVTDLYRSTPSVRAAMGRLAAMVATKDTSAMLRQYPYLQPVFERMIGEQADTAEKVRDYFANEANVSAIVQGNPVHATGMVGGIIPHLTFAGQTRLAVKGILTRPIDWAADHGAEVPVEPGDVIDHPLNPPGPIDRLITGAGGLARSLTTLIPRSHTFDPYNPKAASTLHDLALVGGLTRGRADAVVNKFFATPDLAEKRQIYWGLMKEVGIQSGWSDSSDLWKSWLAKYASEDSGAVTDARRYAPGTIDRFDSNGIPTHVGIGTEDLTHEWAVPSVEDLFVNGKKANLTRATVGAINNQGLNRFMNVWRKMVLTRPGFALRFAGEEAFGFLLREGPAAYARSRLAMSAMKNGAEWQEWQKFLNPHDLETGGIWDRMTGHLPQTVKDKITSPAELVAQTVGTAAHRALSGVEGRLAGERYVNAARQMAIHGELDPDNVAKSFVFAGEGHGMGVVDSDLHGANRADVVVDGRLMRAEIKGTGKYSEIGPGDPTYLHIWNTQLRKIAQDPWKREALLTRDQPFAVRQDAVANKIMSMPQVWSKSIRSLGTRDGRLVATGEVTRREAALDHAQAVIDATDTALVSPRTGQPIPGLAEHLAQHGRAPSVPALNEIDQADRPVHVHGPETVRVITKPNLFNKLSDAIWERQIGPMMNWISREPMMLHQYALSRPLEASRLDRLGSTLSAENMESLVHDNAYQRALNATIPYIHDPNLKSEFSAVTRNLSPFWFAQEQFYKRWARNVSYAPWAFRQAQLINMGVKHSGFVHTDPQTGHEYFVYPGSAITQDVLTRTLSAFGIKSQLPINGALIGQVNQMSPGLERLGVPSFSPFVVMSLNELKSLDPAMTAPINAAEGSASASSGLLKALLPTTLTRIVDTIDPAAIDPSQYASAQMQAIQYLEATGHGLGQPAVNDLGTYNRVGAPAGVPGSFKAGDYVTDSAGQKYVHQPDGTWKVDDGTTQQQYLARVQNWTRILLATRLIFGFSGPASPELQFNPDNLHSDLQTYLKELPFNEALQAFLAQHPNANAYTVFQTATASGNPLPATAAAQTYLDANRQFMGQHPLSGSFFIPQGDTSGKFDLAAYQQQMAEQMRQRKNPTDFWKQAVYNAAATPYFKAEDRKNLMLANPAAYGVTKQRIQDDWTQWSAQFYAANPVFADYLTSSNGSLKRQQVMQDVGAALTQIDKGQASVRVSPQVEDIRRVYQNWVMYQSLTQNYGSPNAPRLNSTQLLSVQEQFAQWGADFVKAHPDVADLWNRAIRPGLTTATNILAQGSQQ